MSFHEIRFPLRLSFGATGGPERRTDIVALASGFEERNSLWAHSRRRYNAGHAVAGLDDLMEVIAFFEARRGRLFGFRLRDPIDHASAMPSATPSGLDQLLGSGDGVKTIFTLTKTYSSGGVAYTRPIKKPVAGSVLVTVAGLARTEGVHFTLDTTMGAVTFLAGHVPPPGAEVRAGFLFDVPVRFDTDHLDISLAAFRAGEIPDIPLVELRLP